MSRSIVELLYPDKRYSNKEFSQTEVVEATWQTEIALLGAIMIQAADGTSKALKQVRLLVKPTDFIYSNSKWCKHKRIYEAMLNCQSAPNQIAVAETMAARKTLCKGDIAYLSNCIAECPCSLDYIYYAEAVKRYSDARNPQVNAKPRFQGAV